jgi:hypothetical protein
MVSRWLRNCSAAPCTPKMLSAPIVLAPLNIRAAPPF